MKTEHQAFITPEVFRWAIARANSTPEKLAKKLHTGPSAVASWEQGKALPTFSQAQKLAEALYIPFGYLFLPSPPDERVPLKDFRTHPGKRLSPSAELIDLVNDVIVKQQWYSEFLLASGATPLPFVGRYSVNGVDAIATSIRETIRIDELRKGAVAWEEFFRLIIRNTEAAGILVMRSGIAVGNPRRPLSVQEFRGFAISDRIAPLIFINNRDWRRAQLFTIAHELAHIWIGAGGISNEDLKDISVNAANDVERFCNSVAAEVLLPRSEFLLAWSKSERVNENLNTIAHQFRVSFLVALRRAFTLQRISHQEYRTLYEREERQFKEVQEKNKGGGSFYRNVLVRNSATLTNALVTGAISGKVLYREAAALLNVPVPTVQKIARYLAKPKEVT